MSLHVKYTTTKGQVSYILYTL